jgi:hypothetical protein
MRDGIAIDSLPDEYYVIQMDGLIKSEHRRFLDALRAGLQLRGQYPQHDVKLRTMRTRAPTAHVMH